MFEKLKVAVKSVEDAVKAGDQGRVEEEKDNLLRDAKDVLSDWLDSKIGSSVTENKIFSELPRYLN